MSKEIIPEAVMEVVAWLGYTLHITDAFLEFERRDGNNNKPAYFRAEGKKEFCSSLLIGLEAAYPGCTTLEGRLRR